MGGFEGFVVSPLYRVVDGRPVVFLYGRLSNGKRFKAVFDDFKPYFFVRTADLSKIRKLSGLPDFSVEKTGLLNFDREKVSKIVVSLPKDVPPLRDAFSSIGVKTFEADVRFEYRFLMDYNIKGGIRFLDSPVEESSVFLFRNPEVEPVEYFPENLVVLSLDIETDKEGKSIYSVALASNTGFSRVLMVSSSPVEGVEVFPSEKELLERFVSLVKNVDPDVITGWNVVDFDLYFLLLKARRLGLALSLGSSEDEIKIKRFSSFFRESRVSVEGRIVLDGISALKNSFIQLEDYKLNTAAKFFVGEEKVFTGDDRHLLIDKAYSDDKKLLAEYNLKDAVLVLQILEKSGAFKLSVKRSLLTGMPLDRVSASIASLDQVYLPRLRLRGFVAPTSSFVSSNSRTVGGYVMQSKPGIYDFVLVCDFKSLYPSIMRTFNIDPLMFRDPCKRGDIRAPNGACFRREEGVLPSIIAEILVKREAAAKSGDSLGRYALKILMNSFYGVMASPNCRFYNLKISNAITSFARFFIQMLESKLRREGYDVIYGDTDSLFVDLKVSSEDDAVKLGKRLVRDINAFLGSYVKKEFGVESFLELEFEKVFVRFLMPKIRHGEKGAKKRYAGLVNKNGKYVIDFVGLEVVRRDWTELAKKFQEELLRRVFNREEVDDFIRGFVSDVKKGKMDSLLVYRKAVRKDLDSYVKTTPPHVKAARLLPELKSNIIEYVITVDGPQPVSLVTSSIDYDHYINKQLKPIADSLLVFSGKSFDDIIKGSKQTSLGSF